MGVFIIPEWRNACPKLRLAFMKQNEKTLNRCAGCGGHVQDLGTFDYSAVK